MSARARTARVAAVALALAAALLIALPAAPAAAATPNCNIAMVWTNSAGVDLFMAGFDGGSVVRFTPDCLMRQGDVGNDVAEMQDSLNSCYGEHLAVDRVFGKLTRAALVRTQKKVKVTADGVYGPKTRRAMKHRRVGGGACASSL